MRAVGTLGECLPEPRALTSSKKRSSSVTSIGLVHWGTGPSRGSSWAVAAVANSRSRIGIGSRCGCAADRTRARSVKAGARAEAPPAARAAGRPGEADGTLRRYP
jgi:hypothetical protein